MQTKSQNALKTSSEIFDAEENGCREKKQEGLWWEKK